MVGLLFWLYSWNVLSVSDTFVFELCVIQPKCVKLQMFSDYLVDIIIFPKIPNCCPN